MSVRKMMIDMVMKTVTWKVNIPEGTSASHTGDPTCEENVSVILPDTLLAMPSLVKTRHYCVGMTVQVSEDIKNNVRRKQAL